MSYRLDGASEQGEREFMTGEGLQNVSYALLLALMVYVAIVGG